MLFLKSLRLKNFCNYEDYTFNFTKENGDPYKFICFFGPNGVGKSTLLEAISMLSGDQSNRPLNLVQNSLQKYVRNKDYSPTYNRIQQGKNDKNDTTMLIEGVYSTNNKDYTVSLTQEGWIRNDLASLEGPWGENHLRHRQRLAHFITSDSDLSLNTFQIHKDCAENFERIVSIITRFKAECIQPSSMTDNPSNRDYCTDFVLIKNNHRIHYKRMSAGEKKICKSFSDLLNLINTLENPVKGEPKMIGYPRILLLDNVELHIYYDRHVTMVDCLKTVFSEQQIIGTTHSGTLIQRVLAGENDSENELWIDLDKINS